MKEAYYEGSYKVWVRLLYDSSELEKKILLYVPSPEEIKMATQDMVEMLDEKKNDINLQI